jgi:hypothetical protein
MPGAYALCPDVACKSRCQAPFERGMLRLCSKTAEKHGLFAVSEGEDLELQLQARSVDQEGSWKAWSRTESVKR